MLNKFIITSLLLVTLAFGLGCNRAAEDRARLEAARAAELAQALQQKSQTATNELDTVRDELKKARDIAKEAEQQAANLQSKYLEAKKAAEQAEQVANQLADRLQQAEQKINAVRMALADEKTVVKSPAVQNNGFNVRMLSWNVESEGSDPNVIAQQLPALGKYDVYALTEVLPESFGLFRACVGPNFASVDSRTGFNDRMQIIYNTEKFELVRKFELDEINFENRYRSPVVAHLRDKPSGIEFLVLVNHLARGKAEVRAKQATQLVEWAREQTLPMIALGDYNYDFVFADRQGNEGFTNMLRDNIWRWVEPGELIDTNWFDNPAEPDGKDDYPGSLLDFAFVAGPAKDWKAICNVIVREGDFPDDQSSSDHRPFELLITNQ